MSIPSDDRPLDPPRIPRARGRKDRFGFPFIKGARGDLDFDTNDRDKGF
jgi:hypothetical protein